MQLEFRKGREKKRLELLGTFREGYGHEAERIWRETDEIRPSR